MRPVDRELLRTSRPARRHLTATFGLAAVAAGVIVIQASLLAHAVAAGAHGAGLGALRTTLVALAAVVAVRAVIDGAFDAVGRFGATRVMSDLRGRLAEHLLVRRPGIDATERTGELAALSVQGIDTVEPYFARFLPQLALAAFVPVAILAWLVQVDLVPALVLAATLPLIPLFMALVGLTTQSRTAARLRTLELLSAHFLDVVRGLATLRAHVRDGAQAATLAAIGERYRHETMGTLRLAFLSALVLELMAMLGTALVAGIVGVQLAGGHLGLQAGLTVLLLAPELYGPLRQVGAQFHASADGLAATARLREALAEPATVRAPAAARPAPDPARQALRLEAVSFAYGGRAGTVLDSVDLELAPGRTTAIVGPSGAGKSTLAALVLRLADPGAGTVSCGGVDLRDVDPADWRARCAWVPQRARLYAGSVADNLRLGRPDATTTELWDALRDAGAAELVAGLPEDLETEIGDGGRALSAGEAQRLTIARAFIRDAPLLVLDEPTAHLDEVTAAAIDGAVERLRVGRTTLLIAHRPALAARADRVVTIAGGRVADAMVAA